MLCSCCVVYAVHPHACGEHCFYSRLSILVTGSSPRLWGTHRFRVLLGAWARFIPTPVGNTPSVRKSHALIAVHPHACGEHYFPLADATAYIGSSPRLWGTRCLVRSGGSKKRFIPTPVGNTAGGCERCGRKTVHPHACGEHTKRSEVTCVNCGSSPRLWGTPVKTPPQSTFWRFIPTPVGNTLHPAPRSRRTPVHPHACGEHVSHRISIHAWAGSSPRLWGTPRPFLLALSIRRFIPTPVGNTRPRAVLGD